MEYLKARSIKEWAEDDRPREKMLTKGLAALSNAELIAILLRIGTTGESAVELAKKLLNSVENNLNELARLGVKDFQNFKGIGETKAIQIIAALELGRRRKMEEVTDRGRINNSTDVSAVFGALLGDLPYEEFWVLFLNRSNTIIGKEKISQGGISGTVTDVRIILKFALDKMSSSIILCHNHPSGNKKPSEQDISITKKIKEAGALMDIILLDHIIIVLGGFYSFADEGIL
jgi:DNA repair protein RadC